jgi:hypothetical protein
MTYADKGRVLENIGKKIGFLNNFKTCVTSAGSREELKSCRITNKKTMEGFRSTKKANKGRKKTASCCKKRRKRKAPCR